MNPMIAEFALARSGLNAGERNIALGHHSECSCSLCRRFVVYVAVQDTVQRWEQYKLDWTVADILGPK